jgi:hypothetical protein
MQDLRHFSVFFEHGTGERRTEPIPVKMVQPQPDPVLLQRHVELAPDILLPKQFDDVMRRPSLRDGVIRLMFAVLEDAIQCYLASMHGETEKQRRDFMEVQDWFATPSSANRGWQSLFAFEPLCEALGIEPNRLRRELGAIQNGDRAPRRIRRAHRSPGGLVQPTTSAAVRHA